MNPVVPPNPSGDGYAPTRVRAALGVTGVFAAMLAAIGIQAD